MDELEGRIRSWVDSVASDGRRTTADDAIELAEQTGRRSGARPRRLAAALVAAAVVVVVGGLVARGSWTGGDGSLDVAAGPPATAPESSTSDGDPHLLGVVEGNGTGITPFIATSEAELVDMWTSSGLAGDPPTVDFDRYVVIAIAAPRSTCEAEALVDWLAVDPRVTTRDMNAVRFCRAQPTDTAEPTHPVDAAEPVARPTTFLVVVERA